MRWLYPFQGWPAGRRGFHLASPSAAYPTDWRGKQEGGGIIYAPQQTLLFCCCPVSRSLSGRRGWRFFRGVLHHIWDTPPCWRGHCFLLSFELQGYSHPKKKIQQCESSPTTWNDNLEIAPPPSPQPPLLHRPIRTNGPLWWFLPILGVKTILVFGVGAQG